MDRLVTSLFVSGQPTRGAERPGDWSQVEVYDLDGQYLDQLSVYHESIGGCNLYYPGDAQWPNSYYRFHGTKSELRTRGLPRYIRARFVAADGDAYSAPSAVYDLGGVVTTTRYLGLLPVTTLTHYDLLGQRVGQTDAHSTRPLIVSSSTYAPGGTV